MLTLGIVKMARSWYATDLTKHELLGVFIQLPYVLAGAAGLVLGLRKKNPLAVLALILILYFWGMTIISLSILRYMVPAMGFLFIMYPALFETLRARKLSFFK